LYITTNGNKEITGAQLNEVLTNLNDSAFLQLDELRTALSTSYNPANPSDWNVLPTEVKAALDEAISRVEGLENAGFQTAIQTPYTATTPTDWDVVPTELQSSTDELASRLRVFETNNFSQDVAFVSNDGDDLIAELGNAGKPFATIQAAIDAVGNNSTVKVLGGTYNETPTLGVVTISNKNNFVLDLSSCIINAVIVNAGVANENNTLILNGATVNGRITWECDTGSNNVFGGEILTTSSTALEACLIVKNCFCYNVKVNNSSLGFGFLVSGDCAFLFCTSDVQDNRAIAAKSLPNRIFGESCVFTSQNDEAMSVFGTGVFLDCRFTRNVITGTTSTCIGMGADELLKLIDCKVTINSSGNQGIGIDGNLLATLHNTDIVANNGFAGIRVSNIKTIDENFYFTDCYIEGGSFGVYINLENRTDTRQFITGCKITGSNPVGGVYNGADTGLLYVKDCFYSNAFTPLTGVSESGGIVDSNIRKPII
jgi:hypothetical protein